MQNAESFNRAPDANSGAGLMEIPFLASLLALNAAIEPPLPSNNSLGYQAAAEQVRSLLDGGTGRN